MTRGGKNTELHAVVDACGHAVKLALTPAQDHDSTHALKMGADLLPDETLAADKAYDTDAIRAHFAARGVALCIPAKSNRKRPAKHHAGQYKKRHKVENFFQRAKRCHRIGTRYEKAKTMFAAFITLFATMDYIPH